MADEPVISMAGNLVEDPKMRFTSSGLSVTSIRVASTPRYLDKNSGQWIDGSTVFLSGTIWRQQGENTAESLRRGDRVIVKGRLKQSSYETREGEKRTVYEIEVDEIGPSLRFATARVSKVQSQGGFNQNAPTPQAPRPWAEPSPMAGHGVGGPSGGFPEPAQPAAGPWRPFPGEGLAGDGTAAAA